MQLSQDQKQAVSEELADVLIYLVRLADKLNIDLLVEAENKIALNAKKYPIDQSRPQRTFSNTVMRGKILVI